MDSRRSAAAAVFLGTVVDTLPRRDTVPPMARVAVARWWKGGSADTVLVAQQPRVDVTTSCDAPLRIGTTYILFLRRAPSGWLVSRECMGSRERSASDADAVMAALDALDARDAPPPDSASQTATRPRLPHASPTSRTSGAARRKAGNADLRDRRLT